MDRLDLVVQRIDQLRQDQHDRFDRLERRQERQEAKLDRIDGRINRWAGAIAVLGSAGGTALGLALAYVKARWHA